MTTEPNPAHVSQMARDAAAELVCVAQWDDLGGADDIDIATGRCDSIPLVQTFARFEQAIRNLLGETR